MALRPDDELHILSLCTGGGGLDLGVELAIPGARTVCVVEREAFAVAGLVQAMEAGLLAPAPVWSDARTFGGRAWRGLVDGLIGGIPCQPHSLAGKRLGADDERDLWGTARRIIVQTRPWFVLIENVGGMLSSGGAERLWRDMGRLGFAYEVGLFTAAEVGAPHQRERLFILGVADTGHARRPAWDSRGLGRSCETENGERSSTERIGRGPDLANASSARRQERRPDGHRPGQREAAERGGGAPEHAPSLGRGEGQPEPELRRWRTAAGEPDGALGDSFGGGRDRRPHQPQRGSQGRVAAELDGEDDGPLFPPGPGDRDGWRALLARRPEVEPAVRGDADGLAARVGATRIDELRLLGNGVVSLEAAYALRTLATRLAACGSSGAGRLIRMMIT